MAKPEKQKPVNAIAKALLEMLEEERANIANKTTKPDLFVIFFLIAGLGVVAVAYFRK